MNDEIQLQLTDDKTVSVEVQGLCYRHAMNAGAEIWTNDPWFVCSFSWNKSSDKGVVNFMPRKVSRLQSVSCIADSAPSLLPPLIFIYTCIVIVKLYFNKLYMSLPNIKSDLFLVNKWLWQAVFGKNVAEQAALEL